MRLLGAILLMLLMPVARADEAEPLNWKNPLIPQRADPHVTLLSDGYYYLTATAPEYDRLEIRRAKTIAGLATAEVKVVWKKPADGKMSGFIWAPELHFIDNKWYLYFAASEARNVWNIRMYVFENASANPMEGNWSDKGQIKMAWESFTLDATTFEHRGVRYLAWAQSPRRRRGTDVYLAKMDTPWSITGEPAKLTEPNLNWERRGGVQVNEAPAFLVRHGKVFMTYSASATDANYCLGLLTANEDADLLDPKSWSKSQEPVLTSSQQNSQFGPGHNCFTTSRDGKVDIMVYHARNYENVGSDPLKNPDRATRAQVVQWREDGTPIFGPPVADGPYKP